jgi:DNA repair photolyase
MTSPRPLPGRGAVENPANRFERLHYEPDLDAPEDERPAPATQFFRDTSRSIIATNDSPDVGFSASINPYRGCEHGCAYCLGPDTPILYADMTWRPIGNARPGDVVVGFAEYPPPGGTRKYRPAVIEAVWWSKRRTLRLVTPKAEIVTTADHRWLDARNGRWCRTETFTPGRLLRRMAVAPPEPEDGDYRVGYLAGLSLGDGTFRFEPGWRSNRLGFPQSYWRVALADEEPLVRVVNYLRGYRIEAHVRPFDGGPASRRPMQKVEIRSLGSLGILHPLLTLERDTRHYRRGFLAGFFDAEGHNGDVFRLSQVNQAVLERVRQYARSLGFNFCLEPHLGRASTLRLVGRYDERVRFFCLCRPAIRRKADALFGWQMKLGAESIRAIAPGTISDVVDIQTSTRTFLAAGVATHNCYARPTHEYLGFSAGLDFETRIMVKEDAPELLRKELASPKWEPKVLGLSGVTDPYQPVERRLGLTRRCLEVLAEFRNPVGVVTKSRLVTRDADLLGELAQHQAAAVFLSVTTLDGSLARRLEPRAAQPAARLAAVKELTAHGIPTGVLVAPVIPGLNDHEIPAILKAAAEAGARCAGYILLRLPYGVADLFDQWLTRHFPERREKVLGRIRAVRRGRLNDARFGSRMRGEGVQAQLLRDWFRLACRQAGLDKPFPVLSTAAFRRPGGTQRLLFE